MLRKRTNVINTWLSGWRVGGRRRRPSRVREMQPQMARAVRLLRATGRLGVPGAVPAPPELLPAGARVLAQGYLNRFSLPLLNGWLLPPWMRHQSDPTSTLFTPRSVSNIMVNQTARNWTALGIPGHGHSVESMVDQLGLLTPVPGGPSLDWWVRVDGGNLGLMSPARRSAVTQNMQGGLPVVATAYEADGMRVGSEVWAFPGHDGDWTAMQVVLFNIADLPLTGDFYFALRPYNPEGIAPLYTVAWDGQRLLADGRPFLHPWPQPQGWAFSGLRQGDLFAKAPDREPSLQNTRRLRPRQQGTGKGQMRDPHGLAHATLHFRFAIEPWEEAEFLAFLPLHPPQLAGPMRRIKSANTLPQQRIPFFTGIAEDVSRPDPQVYSRAKAATTLRWREVLGDGMDVKLPHRDLQNSWDANRAHLLALHDGDEITPGPDLYHGSWLRDAAYMTYALSACGHQEAASQLVRGFLKRQRREGIFVSQFGEWDSTGQVLWTAAQHLRLHPDSELQSDIAPALERGVQWIVRTLNRSRGLMPPGISSEHLGPPDRYYWDNLWSLAGLESIHELLSHLPLAEVVHQLRRTLDLSWAKDIVGLGRNALPAAPGRPIDLGAVGTLAAWFPLRVMPSDHPLLAGSLQALEEATFYDGALFVHAGHSGWGTYLNMRVAGCRLLQGSPGGWEMMQWLLRHASPTYNWPEAIHPRSGGGSAGDGHHGWASAEWLMLVRLLLFDDNGGTLHITPMLPEEWLAQSGEISVRNAPTAYGALNYTLSWDASGEKLRLQLDPQWRTTPRQIRWSVPGVVGEARVEGMRVECENGCVVMGAEARVVEVKRRPT